MRIGSLFSGAGGLDMAVEQVFGGTTVWQSELAPAACKVLEHRWGVPNLGDITKVDWNAVEPVEVLCGGFPCQDVSSAGFRAGLKDGTRSGLWSMFADAIEALRPQFVVIENVRGLLSAAAERGATTTEEDDDDQSCADPDSDVECRTDEVGDRSGRPVLRAIGAVLGDLSDLRYDAQWVCVGASTVGAPHRRDRVFILATDTDRHGRDRGQERHVEPQARVEASRRDDADRRAVADGGDQRRTTVDLLPTPQAWDGHGFVKTPEQQARQVERGYMPNLGEVIENEIVAKSFARPNRRDKNAAGQVALVDPPTSESMWGKYEPAIRRWEALTRPAPPAVALKDGKPRLAAEFSEWLMGWPEGWVTEVPGITRNDALKICGNGVCPQQAAAALRYLITIAEMAA
jgi:DNA (cytosine-5)-methyltransferase 1